MVLIIIYNLVGSHYVKAYNTNIADSGKLIDSMKILFTNIKMTPPFLLGGDSSLMHTLLIYLQEKGHECYTIGSFDPNIPIFPSWREAINDLKNRKIPHTLSSGLSVFTHKKWPFVIFKNNRSVSYEYKYPCRMVNKEIYPRELQAEIRKNMPD
jgi:hypothetical protein